MELFPARPDPSRPVDSNGCGLPKPMRMALTALVK